MTLLNTISEKLINITSRATSNLPTYLLYFLICLIPFSIRHVFQSIWNFETGAYSDFTSLSMYLNDFIVLALIIVFIISLKNTDFKQQLSKIPKIWIYFACAAMIWLIFELFIQNHSYFVLQSYFSLRLLALILLAWIVSQIQVSRENISWLFTVLGAIQAIIAFIQFYAQKSVGLYILGESHLSPDILGVAKIVSHGTKLIRGYGTFPHPNLLSAFLGTAILFNLYLLIKYYQIPRDMKITRGILLYFSLFLNIFGLFLTFSRGGILAFVISFVLLIAFFARYSEFSEVFKLVTPVILSIILSLAMLAPYLSTRTTISDNSTKERLFYDEIGEKMISKAPFIGLAPGLSVLHMKQFTDFELKPWEIQPIHNYYLIAWAEWGIGAIFILILILLPIILLIVRKVTEFGAVLAAIGTGYLVLFLFDHYFYTIWPTQLLLWVFIGLCLVESSINAISHET